MSDGKKIEIKIAVVGGEQAAAEVLKVGDAAAELTRATGDPNQTKGFGGMLDALPEKAATAETGVKDLNAEVDAMVAKMERASVETKETGAALEEVGSEAEATGPKLDKIINIQRAQVVAELAKGFGLMGEKMRDAAGEFAAADPKLAKTLENTALGLDSVSSALTGAAAGFALGGPFGAAVGTLTGALLPSFNAALDEMVTSLAKASAAESEAARMAAMLADARNGNLTATLNAAEASAALAASYSQETAEIDKLIATIERRNKLTAANETADEAGGEREDARRIRNGEDPQTVKQERVAFNEAADIVKVDRGIESKRTGIRETKNAAIKAEGEFEGMKVRGGVTPEQLADSEKIVTDLKERVAQMEAALAEAESLAVPKKREIREKAAGKIEDLAGQRSQRKAAEKQRADADAEREEKRQEKEAAQSKREAGQAARDAGQGGLDDNARRASTRFGEAGATAGKKGNEKLSAALAGISKTLENGTNEKEMAAVAEKFKAATEGMGGATLGTMERMLDIMTEQAKRVSVIEGRLKNLNTR
mgnify:FL=1